MVNCVSTSSTAQHIEAPISTNNNLLYNQSRHCCMRDFLPKSCISYDWRFVTKIITPQPFSLYKKSPDCKSILELDRHIRFRLTFFKKSVSAYHISSISSSILSSIPLSSRLLKSSPVICSISSTLTINTGNSSFLIAYAALKMRLHPDHPDRKPPYRNVLGIDTVTDNLILPIKFKEIEKDPLENRGEPFTPYNEELRKMESWEGNE